MPSVPSPSQSPATGTVAGQVPAPKLCTNVVGVPGGRRRLQPASPMMLWPPSGMTNDLGEYRLFGLMPGTYVVAAIFNNNGSNVAKLNANSMIEVGAVDSSTSSYRKPKKQVFGSRSVNKVAGLTIGPEDGPRLKFGAFTTTAALYYDSAAKILYGNTDADAAAEFAILVGVSRLAAGDVIL